MTRPEPARDIRTRMIDEKSDQWIARELERCACGGPLWEAVRIDFWIYSDAAFRGLVSARRLPERTAALHRRIVLEPDEAEAIVFDQHAREQIHDDAYVAALDLFASRTRAGQGWIEEGGASLRGYFFNGVLLQAANPVRDWRRARRRRLNKEFGGTDAEILMQYPDEHPGPEERLITSADAEILVRALQRTDEPFRRAMWMRMDTGRPWGEIAREVGVTEKALERQRSRFRTTFTQNSGNQTGGR